MYLLIFVLFVLLSGTLVYFGQVRQRRGLMVAGGLILALTAGVIWFMGFWGEKLWFDSLGYSGRFWTEFFTRLLSAGSFTAAGILFIWLFSLSIKGMDRKVRAGLIVVSGLISARMGFGQWQNVLRFLNRVPAGTSDPLLGRDAGFYLFSLPLIDSVYVLFLILAGIAVITGIVSATPRGSLMLQGDFEGREEPENPPRGGGLFTGAALLLLVLSAGRLLTRFHLLYGYGGVVSGPGWTDARIRLPALTAAFILGVIGALLLFVPRFRNAVGRRVSGLFRSSVNREILSSAGIFGMVIVGWFLMLGLLPWLVQTLLVAPNEITYERPYIEYNIKYTRSAFKLQNIQEDEVRMGKAFNRKTVEENRGIINNTRLWDWRALSSVYQQFQEIRLYYKFGDIDVDRYPINGSKRAVMVAAREMDTTNLPAKSRNFVNRRFKYTHGYGIAMNTVNEFTPSGLPHLLIKDIPPQSETPDLAVKRPEIYYGERTDSYVVVNSSEEEFDYPQGDSNKYVRYAGTGGVRISNFFRKFIYGYLFGGTKFLFSGYPVSSSRIMFHRNIQDRIARLAPFLSFDSDPYIVLVNGELRWIIDGYTTSSSYPYSEHFSLDGRRTGGAEANSPSMTGTEKPLPWGTNYIRNSVKTVVNPYNGDVDFYVYDSDDPIIQVWSRIYPEMFKKKSDMPVELRRHVRYPADFLLIQGEVYAKYHMSDPEVFYNQEDLWVRATEKYYSAVQPVEPYYIMWERPGSNDPEFIVMLPYTPKNKQVLIGWIAGVCDPENYGQFIAYKFPKEQRILGPQQVETKIDQDSFLSGQLSLWDQRGSNVIRGNVLALPLDGTLLYVEPIYLQSETAAYPELRLVVLMHDDTLVYGETLDQALAKLYSDNAQEAASQQQSTAGSSQQTGSTAQNVQSLIQQASEAFNSYTDNTGRGNFSEAAKNLDRLKNLLDKLSSAD